MPLEIVLALAGFCFASSITPGPNNIMLMTSGVNYGFWRTLPHMLGVTGGFAFLLLCIGLGLGQLLSQGPLLFAAIKFVGGTYLLYLAWRIATSGPIKTAGVGKGRPMNFVEAALFQWVNPKGWIMAVTAMATYTSKTDYMTSMAIVIGVFTLINLPSVAVWCGFGTALRHVLENPKILRVFNVTMAVLLIASLWPMLR